MSEPSQGDIGYINREVPTLDNFFDPILEKYLEKDIPVLEKSRIKVTVLH